MSTPSRWSSAKARGLQAPRSKTTVRGRLSSPARTRTSRAARWRSATREEPGSAVHTSTARPEGVGEPGVLDGGHGDGHAGHMGLRKAALAMISGHMPVQVDEALGQAIGGQTVGGEGPPQLPRAVHPAQLLEPSAQGGGRGPPVQAEEPAHGGLSLLADSARPKPNKVAKTKGQHERGHRIEGGPPGPVHRCHRLDEPVVTRAGRIVSTPPMGAPAQSVKAGAAPPAMRRARAAWRQARRGRDERGAPARRRGALRSRPSGMRPPP